MCSFSHEGMNVGTLSTGVILLNIVLETLARYDKLEFLNNTFYLQVLYTLESFQLGYMCEYDYLVSLFFVLFYFIF